MDLAVKYENVVWVVDYFLDFFYLNIDEVFIRIE